MPRPPPHVYSCFVVNQLKESIDCTVFYNGRPGEERDNEVINISMEPKDEKYFSRKIFQPVLPNSYCRWVKIITRILIKKSNGNDVEVNYPFENVQYPTRNWEFHVSEEDIYFQNSQLVRPIFSNMKDLINMNVKFFYVSMIISSLIQLFDK